MAASLDAVMCALINGMQWQLRYLVCTPEQLDSYLSACEPVSRSQFYQDSRGAGSTPDRKSSPVAKSDQICVSGKRYGAGAAVSITFGPAVTDSDISSCANVGQ